ncbi:MAG TPA: V-type ATPase 116kDa subunit family protein [Polyangiaceae bacterium]|nr:V-type ATPase 116kDa subunit family protein [Polyangiaceae bacterium]
MIVDMTRVRIAGPRALLDPTLAVLQDMGVVHVVRPAVPEGSGLVLPVPQDGEVAALRRVLGDAESALELLGVPSSVQAEPRAPDSLPKAALFARRTRRRAERIRRALSAREDERVLLRRYQDFFTAFEPLVGRESGQPDGALRPWRRDVQPFYVVMRAGSAAVLDRLRASLEEAVDGQLELLSRPLPSGELAVLILASTDAAKKVGSLLATSRVEELPAPAGLGETNLLRAMPALRARLAAIPAEVVALEADRASLRAASEDSLSTLRAWLHDRVLVLEARAQAHAGSHVFLVEGWAPKPEVGDVAERLRRDVGPDVIAYAVATEPWSRADAPVALANPPLFRPFEIITRTLPLPRYGTIDPTPFVAVFFPMFFGLILGDVGHGAILALLAVVLRWRSKPKTKLRSISAVVGACAAFTIIFGFVFGELFGDLGKRAFGMPALFDRADALMPFLALSAALGAVHVTLGLVLAIVNAWRQGERRHAFGRGVAAFMVVLTVAAILAALEVLPAGLFTPLALAVVVAFPVLILLEGVVAVVELVSNFGQILSYARIMALGTASLMLAMVANRMVGAMGSVLVGVLFALLFHAVNFVIGVFSPTIHALRLHYVEFFGRFFSPGGTAYRPLAHWHPSEQGS